MAKFPHPCARCAKPATAEIPPDAIELHHYILDTDNPPTGPKLDSAMLCTRCGSLRSRTWFPNLPMTFTD